MIWKLLLISFGFASAEATKYVDPEYLDELWASEQDEEFAQLLNIKIDQVRSDKSEDGYAASKLSNDYPFGDILVPEEQDINYLNFVDRRWPDGKIPYFLSQESYNEEQREILIDAINNLNARTTSLELVPYRGGKDYVFVFNGKTCGFSFVGRAIGQQPIIVAERCLKPGSIQHEFIHAAGLGHEHSRRDRDKYVKVLWKNIPQRYHVQYDISNYGSSSLGPYDYCSIMHYPFIEPNTGKPAFKILKTNVDRSCIGQRKGPTNIDIQKIENLYS